ncbi:viperin family antiviral radical SAM protein [Endozoicomonas numazuensis]|uniref:S-adenosylmethionine-dependent nucleotide dehydratase n=1 Tax=Endozoicomonas numazuensis TaxID=1137799 RepID=A0A081NED0_9GAMM|nr:viperin family antiviral radical SAM protein [Endozoicomonas numazuensis]KEQ16803.1 hypothetical protein GZ78_19195 [Endozoicomonas numazuensis]
MKNQTVSELVINWHITEACNYDCKFCYAKWGRPDEIHREPKLINDTLNSLANFFLHSGNKLKEQMGYENVRLNFAGGEPFLLKKKFTDVLSAAHKAGFKLSIITNGHYLTPSFIQENAGILDMVGISFDAQSQMDREIIGRVDRHGRSFETQNLVETVNLFRCINDNIKIKVNTVVNSVNWEEDFSELIHQLKPEKWKVLQVLPVLDSVSLEVTDHQFNDFARRHQLNGLNPLVESNEVMAGSYLMIDPKGRFYQNSYGNKGYQYSSSIAQVGAETALTQIDFSPDHFSARYRN